MFVGRSVCCLFGRLVGQSVIVSLKRAESYTSMLLSEHLFLFGCRELAVPACLRGVPQGEVNHEGGRRIRIFSFLQVQFLKYIISLSHPIIPWLTDLLPHLNELCEYFYVCLYTQIYLAANSSDNGIVMTCGDGSFGALGHGDWNSSARPKLIEQLLRYVLGTGAIQY